MKFCLKSEVFGYSVFPLDFAICFIGVEPDETGILYITPCKDAELDLYNPLNGADDMALSAINLGLLCMKSETSEDTLKAEIQLFGNSEQLLQMVKITILFIITLI